jgi:ribosome recycling factor
MELKAIESQMKKTIESLKETFSKFRTNRASPGLIDHLQVDAYGDKVVITSVANIVASDARTLTVTPYDDKMVSSIEKAIMEANLGFNPVTAGKVIRVPMPALTEERRKDLIKELGKETETFKISIRNIRHDANNKAKKDADLNDDQKKRLEKSIQELTDKNIKEIDTLFKTKEKEILEF